MISGYRFGPFHLNPANRLLLCGGDPVLLRPKVFDLLLVLVQNPGHLIPYAELMKLVWPAATVEQNNVPVTVAALRRSLRERDPERGYVTAVPGHGYRFDVAVDAIPRDAPDRAAWLPRSFGSPAGVKSIAVLPFRYLNGEPGDQALVPGLADALVTHLSGIRAVIVPTTGCVLRRAICDHDDVAVGRELGVDAVLGGSIHRSGDRIRISVQLVRVSDGGALWADCFDRISAEPFETEDSTAARVTRALRLTLNREADTSGSGTCSNEAYRAYLKGRYFWNKRTEDGLKRGIESFLCAIEEDPHFALAYVGLADCYNLISDYSAAAPQDWFPRARSAARKALELDGTLAAAHTSLACTEMYEWEWEKAREHFERAIELDPGYAIAHQWYAEYLTAAGKFDQAIAEVKRAQELDPLSLMINKDVSEALFYAGEDERAIEQARKTLELDPYFGLVYWNLGRVYDRQEQYDTAIPHLRKALALSGPHPLIMAALGHAYGAAGKRRNAQRVLDHLKRLSKRQYVSSYTIAIILSGMGESAQALEALRHACDERTHWLICLNVEPMLNNLKAFPKFTALVRRVGLQP